MIRKQTEDSSGWSAGGSGKGRKIRQRNKTGSKRTEEEGERKKGKVQMKERRREAKTTDSWWQKVSKWLLKTL